MSYATSAAAVQSAPGSPGTSSSYITQDIKAMAEGSPCSTRLRLHLEVYFLACPTSNAPVESLLQLLKHGAGRFMELPALLEHMSLQTLRSTLNNIDVQDFTLQLPKLRAAPASMECDTDSDSESDCDSEPEPQSDSESEPEPEPVTQPPPRRCSARLAALAPAAPTGPPLPLDYEDPAMLRELKDFCKFFANPNFKTCYNQLQRRLVRNRHPMLMPVFEDPSNQAFLAKLQDLGNINLAGDVNTIDAHSMQLAVAMQQHYSNPGK
ncbi:hypothetical protein QJQ45_000718 [Haematococcus lacustris]|nr:hypothetical protein QJQ45_000718 [Haematococcus lacustris]